MPKSPLSRLWLGLAAVVLVVLVAFVVRERPPAAPVRPAARDLATPDASSAVAGRLPPTPPTPAAAPALAARDALFAFAQPANAADLDAALPAPARTVYYVRLNRAFLAGKQSPFWQPAGAGRVTVPLPDGGSLAVVIDASEMLGAERWTSTGHIDGAPLSRAVFAYNEGFLHASIEDVARGSFALRAATEGFSQFYQVDPTLLAPCGGERRPVIDPAALAAAAARKARAAAAASGITASSAPATAAAENPQRAEVQVMMVYTQAVLTTLSGTARTAALQSAFDAAIAKTNAAFAASLITARLKLVKIYETTYARDGSSGTFVRGLQDEALTALFRTTDGGMDDVHAVRDQVGADIVCLALNRRDSSSIGLSFVLEAPAAALDTLPVDLQGTNLNALFAFSVVEYTSMAGTNVVPHELGHVFGCTHDRQNANSQGAYSYSYGYRFNGADGRQYHDIMAYDPGTQLSYFSTPKVIVPAPVSAPIGIAAGLPGEADCARTIEQDAFELASFRLQTQAAVSPGTLINVATRAYVGTGEQVLIGGFVINGALPKKLLVRGAGPALAGFGVPGTLGDPVLSLYSGQTQMARNDNWTVQAAGGSASAIAATATQVGAFPFFAGSTDAALLVTLPPGAYTAIMEGAGGTTGSGLVEIYEADRNGNKIVNLSTRGYADRSGKEMYGGFVVQGVAGTTKRILVRVLGPTLGRAPYNIGSAMEDPFLQIYNAAGAVLLQNDDWSTGADGGPSAENDFKPTVTIYSEKQISLTGFAPSNRREPCVMLDLLPGNYTAIVKPFELIDPDPEVAQVAKPGVAIIEVYEINP